MLKHIVLGIVLLVGLLAGTAWAGNLLSDAVESGDKSKVEALIAVHYEQVGFGGRLFSPINDKGPI